MKTTLTIYVKETEKKKQSSLFKKFMKGLWKYIKRTWAVKAVSILFAWAIFYHASITPNLNIVEEYACVMCLTGVMFAFIFIPNSIYKTFIGEP